MFLGDQMLARCAPPSATSPGRRVSTTGPSAAEDEALQRLCGLRDPFAAMAYRDPLSNRKPHACHRRYLLLTAGERHQREMKVQQRLTQCADTPFTVSVRSGAITDVFYTRPGLGLPPKMESLEQRARLWATHRAPPTRIPTADNANWVPANDLVEPHARSEDADEAISTAFFAHDYHRPLMRRALDDARSGQILKVHVSQQPQAYVQQLYHGNLDGDSDAAPLYNHALWETDLVVGANPDGALITMERISASNIRGRHGWVRIRVPIGAVWGRAAEGLLKRLLQKVLDIRQAALHRFISTEQKTELEQLTVEHCTAIATNFPKKARRRLLNNLAADNLLAAVEREHGGGGTCSRA
ncbi:hypothetical protein JKP88DRAFT_353391 [Tribonema minus]|uniref:Uncharacterized protein n=1 Tax=Tribonema minus TaxID=303371 RepID=A0A836CM22_9STRA|nr:hypothetical protein JKP88DRAFT_353391 [Tribonema minus]